MRGSVFKFIILSALDRRSDRAQMMADGRAGIFIHVSEPVGPKHSRLMREGHCSYIFDFLDPGGRVRPRSTRSWHIFYEDLIPVTVLHLGGIPDARILFRSPGKRVHLPKAAVVEVDLLG